MNSNEAYLIVIATFLLLVIVSAAGEEVDTAEAGDAAASSLALALAVAKGSRPRISAKRAAFSPLHDTKSICKKTRWALFSLSRGLPSAQQMKLGKDLG